jgi:DNA invertase Pin-like site-specific DNA recombinase
MFSGRYIYAPKKAKEVPLIVWIHQKLELLEFARKQGCKIDEFVEITISSRKTSKQRRIDELVQILDETDTLIVTELSRLGRSTAEVIALVNALIERIFGSSRSNKTSTSTNRI